MEGEVLEDVMEGEWGVEQGPKGSTHVLVWGGEVLVLGVMPMTADW